MNSKETDDLRWGKTEKGRGLSCCAFCGQPAAGVYYGHNTGRPIKVCAARLDGIKRHGLFRWNDGKQVSHA